MSEVTGNSGFYSSDVQVGKDNLSTGTVNFGGVNISAADAAEFVMMHRSQVMKKVGADRTELAQQHLDRIKTARQYLNDLIDLKKFVDTGKSYKDRAPVTPEMVDFLKNEVGCSPGEYTQQVDFYGSAVSKLPQSVLEHYGLDEGLQEDGEFNPDRGGPFKMEWRPGNNEYAIHGVTCIHKDNLDDAKEELNNYIDLQNDSNNLFMTKFKSVVNGMNEALEGANSMADKTHDTVKNLVSRW